MMLRAVISAVVMRLLLYICVAGDAEFLLRGFKTLFLFREGLVEFFGLRSVKFIHPAWNELPLMVIQEAF